MTAMIIGDQLVGAAATLPVINPASGEPIAEIPDAGFEQLDQAVAAARRAFPGWRDTPHTVRQQAVGSIGDCIEGRLDELAALLTREQGKPLDQARVEISTAATWCRAMATQAIEDRIIEESDTHSAIVRPVPVGVVGAISPWNFPVLLSIWKIAPALLMGNTVVLKPSPWTPLTILAICADLTRILPPGVLNVVTGGDALGPLMTAHSGIDKISFTGSTATGRNVMASAAPTLKRLTLELGGNDPAIVLDDVDIDLAAQGVFWSAFTNSGQLCVASKRAYIEESVYDRFAAALVDIARTARVGDGAEPGVMLGPVQNARQHQSIALLLADCRANGHVFLTGGEVADGPGYFVPVTLIDNPPHDSRIVREEQFGPILPLIRVSDADEAVRLANDSEYGLAATIWSGSEARARAIAPRLECGNVWINEAIALSPFTPFCGHKQSGIGVENGVEGLREFVNYQTITARRTPQAGADLAMTTESGA